MFQLTRPRGTRRSTLERDSTNSSFNSRVRGGRDVPPAVTSSRRRRFQLTRPRGTRPTCMTLCAMWSAFQLTRPRGTRRGRGERADRGQCFNSRVRGGRDFFADILRAGNKVSTHASAGDATSNRVMQNMPILFQLTRPRGTRPTWYDLGDALKGFNSRVRGGRDHLRAGGACIQRVSTHASAGDAT